MKKSRLQELANIKESLERTLQKNIMDEQPNRLANAIEETMKNIDPNMSYKHFAEAVALILDDGFGQHNYKPFVDYLRKLLNT